LLADFNRIANYRWNASPAPACRSM
jgi:hypothetical protein